MASAQASGVRKPGTPASASIASARGASGTRKAASGRPAPALSMIGRTVDSGCARDAVQAELKKNAEELERARQVPIG
jgi:hypothetical protein